MSDRELLEAILTELQAQGVRLAAVEASCARLSPPSALKAADLSMLRVLLPALASAFPGGRAFKVREAKLSSHLVRQITATTSAKALGKLLAKAEGHVIERCLVRCAGEEGGSALWAVEVFKVLSGFSEDLKAA